MVSPIFTGYKPGDEQEGWYAGRQMRGGGKGWGISPIPPYEFTNVVGEVDTYLDQMAGGANDLGSNAKKIWVGQWESAFRLGGGFSDREFVDTEEAGRNLTDDDNEYIGAFDVSYRINPLEWIRDPIGTAKKQAQEIYKSTINFEDLRRKAAYRATARMLNGVQYDETTGLPIPDTKLEAGMRKSFTDRFVSKFESRTGMASLPNVSLRLTDENVYRALKQKSPSGGKYTTYIPSGKTLQDAYLKFDSQKQVSSKREKTFRALQTTVGQSIWDEWSQKTQAQKDALINRVATSPAEAARLLYTVESFGWYTELADSFGDLTALSFGLASGSVSGLLAAAPGIPNSKRLHKATATTKDYDVAKIKVGGYSGFVVTAAGEIALVREKIANDTRLSPAERTRALETYNRSVFGVEENLKTLYKAAGFADPIGAYTKDAANALVDIRAGRAVRDTTELKTAWLDTLDNKDIAGINKMRIGFTDFNSGKAYGITGAGVRKIFGKEINTSPGNGFSGSDVGSKGSHAQFLDSYRRLFLSPGRGTPTTESLLPLILAGDPTNNMSLSYKSMVLLNKSLGDYKLQSAQELYAYLMEGRFTSNIAKIRFFARLPNWTPRALAVSLMTGNHYFGLKIDPVNFDLYKADPKNISILYRPGSWFVDKLTSRNNKITSLLFTNRFDISLKGGFLLSGVLGGSHFQALPTLNLFVFKNVQSFKKIFEVVDSTTGLPLQIELMTHLAGLMQRDPSITDVRQAFLFTLLNVKDGAEFDRLFGTLPGFSPVGSSYDVNYKDAFFKFQNWLKSKEVNDVLGLYDATGNFKSDKLNVATSLLAWFKDRDASQSYPDAGRAFVGVLEKSTSFLNSVTDKILNFKFRGIPVGRIFAVQAAVWEIAYNKMFMFLEKLVRKIFSKFLTGAIVAGTGGLATPIAWLIDKLAYLFAAKITKIFTKFSSAVLHFDFKTIGQMFEDTVTATLKFTAYTSLLILIPVVIIFALLAGIISNISPIEPYSYNNLEFGVTPGPAPPLTITPGACTNQCIFAGSVSSQITSYTGNEAGGHGSNNYWNNIPSSISRCGINIPTNGGPGAFGGSLGPTSSLDNAGDSIRNYCHDQPITTSFYGRAWDIAPASGAGTTVCAPAMSGVAYWKVGQSLGQSNGFMVDVSGFSVSDELVYTLRVIHLGSIVRTADQIQPGDSIGTVWDWGSNSHVHLELKDINNNIIAPETAGICAGS